MDKLNYIGQTGWVCPKCERVYSPYTPMCSYCVPVKANTVTCTNLDSTGTSITNNSSGFPNYPPGVRVINPKPTKE